MSESVLSMYDKDYLYSYDLDGKDVTVCIERVKQGEIDSHRKGEKPTKKPVLYFKGKEKGLMLCITNTRTIINVYGTDKARDWVGKWITLYPTTTTFGSKTVDCIRIRPEVPAKGRAAGDAKGLTRSRPTMADSDRTHPEMYRENTDLNIAPEADSDGVVQDQPPSDTNGDT